MRDSQMRLAKRLERMEILAQVNRPVQPGVSAPASIQDIPAPTLTVVKLKPKAAPAPKLQTRIDVVEPDSEQVEMMVSAAPESSESALDRPDPEVLDAEFEQAVSALRTGNVDGGIAKLEKFAAENGRHPQADNAIYFAGLGHIGLNDFARAALSFERLLEQYPAGDAVQDGMLRLAECRMRLKQPHDAKALYTRVLTLYPGTAAATQAEQRLASLSH